MVVVLLLRPGTKQVKEMYLAGPSLPSFPSNTSMSTQIHKVTAGAAVSSTIVV
jgi:hypothetical protein